jgi:enoyl-CoA hydratase/carnithine racemase
MELENIIYKKKNFKEGAVATITLNKPETLNAMDFELTEDSSRVSTTEPNMGVQLPLYF